MQSRPVIFSQLQSLTTEKRNNKSLKIDEMSIEEILTVINSEDRSVSLAVKKEIPHIKKAVELVIKAFLNNGRLFYVGAGTSGRLGVLDATECPPTFGTRPPMIQGILAGGKKAMFRAQEGTEDRAEFGRKDVRAKNICEKDVVCGVTASMRTPYVIAAIEEAKHLGARTIYVTTNPRSSLKKPDFQNLYKNIDVAICPEVGPEVIMGSTRMKSGTAQKLVLNMITTTAMIRLGKVYENMMIDLRMNSRKLEERAKRVLMISTGVDYRTAASVLRKAGWHVKTAIVMIRASVGVAEARRRLKNSDGFVRTAISGRKA